MFQLRPQVSGLQFTGQVAAADIHPLVLVYHAPEELAPVGAFFANHLRTFSKTLIVDDQQTTFAAACVVLGFVEAERSHVRSEERRVGKECRSRGWRDD